MSYYAYEELIETTEEEQQRIEQQAEQLEDEIQWDNIKMYHELQAAGLW